MDTLVPSPLTTAPARLVDQLDAETIRARYREGGVDVSDYVPETGTVDIYRCPDTGYRFFHPPSLAGEADFYEQLYDPASESGGDRDYRSWSDDYQYAFERIVDGERLLDVGCGFGYFLRRAAEKAEVTGIDGNKFAQSHCHKLGLDVHLGYSSDYREQFAATFDTVTAFQILEHIYDVRGFLNDLTAMVKPGGRLIIAVPNNEPYLRRFDPYNTWNCPPHHVGLWNRDSLEKAAALFGLESVDHAYCEVSGRWSVEAYLHARQMLGIKQEICQHSLGQKLKMLALAPYTVPMSLIRHVRKGGLGTRNVIVTTFRKREP
ncbi:MAG: class I SAM-dependent methyltransferase [Pseudomonadota bacterium]